MYWMKVEENVEVWGVKDNFEEDGWKWVEYLKLYLKSYG